MISDEKNGKEEDKVEEEEDDDFAEFEAADYVQCSDNSTDSVAINSVPGVQEPFSIRIENLIKRIFNDQSDGCSSDDERIGTECGASEESADKLECNEVVQEQSSNSMKVWNAIQGQGREEGSAPSSLKLKWPSTHAFQLFLGSLNIDQRNILRNNAMPFFAAGLGHLLEPSKPTSATIPPVPSCSDSTKNGSCDGETISNFASVNCSRACSVSGAVEHMPAVYFDWTSSGLTNPLDHQKTGPNEVATSANLDLDFFITKEFGSREKSKPIRVFSLEDELLRTDLDITECSLHQTDEIIASLLNGTKNTSLIVSSLTSSPSLSRKSTSSLSSEANLILSELPDISFMRCLALTVSNSFVRSKD